METKCLIPQTPRDPELNHYTALGNLGMKHLNGVSSNLLRFSLRQALYVTNLGLGSLVPQLLECWNLKAVRRHPNHRALLSALLEQGVN